MRKLRFRNVSFPLPVGGNNLLKHHSYFSPPSRYLMGALDLMADALGGRKVSPLRYGRQRGLRILGLPGAT